MQRRRRECIELVDQWPEHRYNPEWGKVTMSVGYAI